ncbi:MAG: UDP-N-acetylmuramate--L-alanine ligase [Candidatus Omnitrophota bacterium]
MKEKIHFIGIGGIGMSGLAAFSLAKNKAVSGSDLEKNDLTARLGRDGATVYEGHSEDNIADDVKLVVRSACIKDDNPEIVKARRLDIPVISRGEYLKRVMEEFPVSIAVTGTHGKTTTSGLIAHILECCGKDPAALIGGEIEILKGNAKYGRGDIIVAEVDESDGTFSEIKSTHALITSIEREHMDHYDSMENVVKAYREFVSRISPQGTFFFNGEDPTVRHLSREVERKKGSFGINGDFQVTCKGLECTKSIEFDSVVSGVDFGRIKSPLVGRHNVMNILGAIAVSMSMGLGFEKVSEAIGSFSGVKRRFEVIDRVGTIEVIEDYAHHPTELDAVISAARDYSEGRVITIFQPHRYSRTRDLAGSFVNCFYDSNVLILTDVYSAFEDKTEETDIRDIFNGIDKDRFEILDFMEMDRIPEYVSGIVRENDLVLVLGAGDIRKISGAIAEKIREKKGD